MKQIEIVACNLLAGKKVTSMVMFDLGITRLAALVKQLRDIGFKIETEMKHNGRTLYASYKMRKNLELAVKITKGKVKITRGHIPVEQETKKSIF